MRKIKIFLFSIWLVILIIPATIPARAEDNCAWRAETTLTSPEIGVGQPPDPCKENNELRPEAGSETNCLATPRPADSSSGYAYTRYICCCKETIPAPIITAPKFIMPELQINIPTLDLTEPKCVLNDDGSFHCEIPWLGQYIIAIYNYGLSVAGILAAIILMAGGVLWLVSGGDASKVTQAKELITGSIVGLVILASSYIILTQINPDLVKFKAISIETIRGKQVGLATGRNSTKAADFRNASCATEDELANGVEFYATGYYKPAWEDSDNFRCVVAMQCSCPLGQDTTKNCNQLYGKTFPGYHPCKAFPENTPYCNMTASGSAPKDGDIAGPGNCLETLPYGSKVCFRGQTYTITDTGGGIRGKRIDVWSGNNLNKALSVTGTGTLTKGPCDKVTSPLAGTFNTAGWSFQANIKNQAGDAGPELGGLLNCMKPKLNPGVGVISSISDSNHIGDLSSCNKASCSTTSCVHTCYSCHYGGGINTNKSYAADFGDEGNFAAIKAAALSCDPGAYVLLEPMTAPDHVHISVSACPKN